MERLTEHQPDLHAFCRALLPSFPDDAAEVAQQVNLLLIRNAEKFSPELPFRPWMFQFAKREIAHFLRGKSRERCVFDGELLAKAAKYLCEEPPDAGNSSLLRKLIACKKLLSQKERDLLELKYTQKLSAGKIAKQSGKSVQSVYNQLAYIRRKLAKCVRTGVCAIAPEEAEDTLRDRVEQAFIEGLLYGIPEHERPFRRQIAWKIAAAAVFAASVSLAIHMNMGRTSANTPVNEENMSRKSTAALVAASVCAAVAVAENEPPAHDNVASTEIVAISAKGTLDATARSVQSSAKVTLDATAKSSAISIAKPINTNKPTGTIIYLF